MERGTSFQLEVGQTYVLGRADGVDFKIRSSGVSKKHCKITVLSGSKVQVEDLGSSNGTFVNGVLIKNHTLKAGELLGLHDVVLQLSLKAPDLQIQPVNQAPQFSGNAAIQLESIVDSNPSFESPSFNLVDTPAEPQSFGEKVGAWFESNIYPWADRISSAYDVRLLLTIVFIVWSIFLTTLSIMPFAQNANQRVVDQSIEVARLYARQLVRLNQKAIVEQRYRDLVSQLDAKAGDTPGLITAKILDASKAQVLAPPESLGAALESRAEQKSLSQLGEWAEVSDQGIASVSAPIYVGTPDGNVVAAVAFVSFDTVRARFSFAALLDQGVTAFLYGLIASSLLLIVVYRWINGSLTVLADRADVAMKKSESQVNLDTRWPALNRLAEQMSFALGRATGSGPKSGGGGGASSDWVIASTHGSGCAAAGLDSNQTVVAWNLKMARLIGIDANRALGQALSDASRDIAFENSVKDLAGQALMSPWAPVTKELEFSGVPHSLSVTYGDGHYLVSVGKIES
jgi:hypothetical protein